MRPTRARGGAKRERRDVALSPCAREVAAAEPGKWNMWRLHVPHVCVLFDAMVRVSDARRKWDVALQFPNDSG